MAIWAIADLHLSFGTPGKKMDIFGNEWVNHPEKLEKNWKSCVRDDDLVLLPGDISWAMHFEQALPDLNWIDALPGTKVMIRGNHDYWWSSLKKMVAKMPPSIHLIQNNVFRWNEYCIVGTRLWDSDEYGFDKYIRELPKEKQESIPFVLQEEKDKEHPKKIFDREIGRLEISLKAIPPVSLKKIAMTHYPPIGVRLQESRVSLLLEDYDIEACVFGHIHSVLHDFDPLFGTRNGIRYALVAADYLNFAPLLIYE